MMFHRVEPVTLSEAWWVYRETYRNFSGYMWDESAEKADFEALFAKRPEGFFLISEESGPVGFCVLDAGERTGKPAYGLRKFCILPQFQGQGKGFVALQIMQSMANQSGRMLWLKVLHHNKVACHLYQKAGFEICGHDADYMMMECQIRTGFKHQR